MMRTSRNILSDGMPFSSAASLENKKTSHDDDDEMFRLVKGLGFRDHQMFRRISGKQENEASSLHATTRMNLSPSLHLFLVYSFFLVYNFSS